MLAAEALRLAAIEVLCPTAANEGSTAFPTLAGRRVLDSRAAEVNDLDESLPYTPVLSLYTSRSQIVSRGEAADEGDNDCQAVLEVVGELAVVAGDGEGEPYADALAGSDPEARLVLAALMSQVRFLLEFSQGGSLFRDMRMSARRVEFETMALPEYGLRWHRIVMRFICDVPNDSFDQVGGGLPEPIRSLADRLPENSYALGKLRDLAALFGAEPLTSLAGITISTGPNREPIASIGETG